MPAHPIYAQIGPLIQRRRKKLRLKQRDLAASLGISRGSLANIETGRQSILVHQLYRFAEVLQLLPSDLLPATADHRLAETLADILPAGLKQQQKEQLAKFLEPALAESEKQKGK